MKIDKALLFFITAFVLLGSVFAYETLPVYNPYGKHMQYITTGNFTNDNIIVDNITVMNNMNMTNGNITNINCITFQSGGMICDLA